MKGDRLALSITRERLLELMREHKTQHAVGSALGISRESVGRLAKRYGIKWEQHYPLQGNAAWQELGR